jgi:ubiquinone/menaquinone biosynthesis C-methylase UbiE
MNRKSHWEKVYSDKSPLEVSWYQKAPELSLQLIRDSGIKKDEPLIDVGGGASILVDRLHTEGFNHLAVLDISAKALAWAQKQLGEAAEKVEWFESDVTEFAAPHPFMLWHDRAVFHFLTKAVDRKRYVEVLKRTLAAEGHLIIAAFAIGGPTRCSGLDIVQYDARKLSAELGTEFQLVEECSELHITPGSSEQQFTYFRFVRRTG